MIDIKSKVVYISGPISNSDWSETKGKFDEIHRKLNDLGAVKVYNPVYFDKPSPESSLDEIERWTFYMRHSLKKLTECSTIVMMKGYHASKGARLEKYVAENLGITVIHERYLNETKTDI